MTSTELIQIAAGLIGSLCFGILFNMRGKRLITAAVGGLLSWRLFVLLSHYILSEPINYFIVAAIVSLYSEIMARILILIPETTVDKFDGRNYVCRRWTSSPYDSMLSSSALTYIISAHHLCLLTF